MFKKLFGLGKKNKDNEVEEVIDEVSVEDSIEESVQAVEVGEVVDAFVEEAMNASFESEDVAPEVEPVLEEIAEEPEVVEPVVEEVAPEPEAEAPVTEETIVEPEVEEEEEVVEDAKPKKSFFSKLKDGLLKTKKGFTDKIEDLIYNYGEIDEDLLEELEEILIMADVGMPTTMKIIDELRDALRERKITDSKDIKPVLKDVIEGLITSDMDFDLNVKESPSVIFVIGVNGAGKTTSIGKIAHNLQQDKKSVILAAADTFRAAAIDQLQVWGDRAGVTVIAQGEGSDPAAVVFDSVQAAKARKADVLICDTAGRLHNKVNLMKELAKMFKVVEREYPHANKEVLLVLDATTGQNALQQAKLFKESANITGIVLTKLDGTAKGGVVLAINSELGIPVKLIGVGEGIDDMQKFNPHDFVDALLNS